MQESSTYQHILEEGRQEGRREGQVRHAQGVLARQGRQRFGAPRKAVEAALLAITDLERLDRMIDRVLQAADWNDLLSMPRMALARRGCPTRRLFVRRFFANQFKRSCLPDGPKVGTISLSPGVVIKRIPSDAAATLWLKWAEAK